jgi:hypothetical protein
MNPVRVGVMRVARATFDTISQSAHFFSGATVGLAGLHFGHEYLFGSIFLFVIATKEAIFDPLIESPDVRGSGLRDFVFTLFGVAVGIALGLL